MHAISQLHFGRVEQERYVHYVTRAITLHLAHFVQQNDVLT